MKTPRGVDARSLTKALAADGFAESRVVGSHHRFKHPDGRAVTVAYHKLSDTFPIGTLKQMLQDAAWTESDLYRLRLID